MPVQHCRLSVTAQIADVDAGAGTGVRSQLFLRHGSAFQAACEVLLQQYGAIAPPCRITIGGEVARQDFLLQIKAAGAF